MSFSTEFVETLNSRNVRPIDRIRMARLLATRDRALDAVDRLLTPIAQSAEDPADRDAAEFDLALCRIAQKRFVEAMALIAPERTILGEMGIGENFNYAMAEWGATHHVPVDLFQRVWLTHEHSPRDAGANYLQCLAIALWADGRTAEARNAVEGSRKALVEGEKTFSAWRYLYVDGDEFQQDLNSIEKMLVGGGEGPLIFR